MSAVLAAPADDQPDYATAAWERGSASLMLIWLEQVGASVSTGF